MLNLRNVLRNTKKKAWLDAIYVFQRFCDKWNVNGNCRTNGKSVNTTPKEIVQILSMYVHMDSVQMPSVWTYRDMETKYPAVYDVMSRDSWSCWHLFTFRTTSVHLIMRREINCETPMAMVLRKHFLSITPEECHAADEIMVPFKGKSHLVYMPPKPHRRGFEMWGHAGQSGILYDWCLTRGRKSRPSKIWCCHWKC